MSQTHAVKVTASGSAYGGASLTLGCTKDNCDWYHEFDTRYPMFEDLAAIAEEHEASSDTPDWDCGSGYCDPNTGCPACTERDHWTHRS